MIWFLGVALAAPIDAARAAHNRGDPEGERAACRAVVAAAPESVDGAACSARLGALTARADADGGLAGLAALEAARRGGDVDVEGLLDGDGAPQLRAEAGLWLAERALARGDRAGAAAILARTPVVEGPTGVLLAQARAASAPPGWPGWLWAAVGVVAAQLGVAAARQARPFRASRGLWVWGLSGVGALGIVALREPGTLPVLALLWLAWGVQHQLSVGAQPRMGWSWPLASALAAAALGVIGAWPLGFFDG